VKKANEVEEYNDPRSKPGKKRYQKVNIKFANYKYIYYIAGLYN